MKNLVKQPGFRLLSMLFKTEGIVLRAVRYGETSLILTIFTQMFGIQSYLVNGVRNSKKGTGRGNILQPAHLLDLVVYHRDQRNLQRISDFKLGYIFNGLYSNIIKNSLALFMSELLYKTLTEPEPNEELFSFSKEAIIWMDGQKSKTLSNFPPYFILKMMQNLGFGISGTYCPKTPYFDLREGEFVADMDNEFTLEEELSEPVYMLSRIPSFEHLATLKLLPESRRGLLDALLSFVKFHIAGFREMQSIRILRNVLH